jgi:hypothetical protein
MQSPDVHFELRRLVGLAERSLPRDPVSGLNIENDTFFQECKKTKTINIRNSLVVTHIMMKIIVERISPMYLHLSLWMI